jgi:hypothetical protein
MSNKAIKSWISEVNNGKSVVVASRLKAIHPLTDRIVRKIVCIDKLEYIWVGHDKILASNEIKIEGSRKIPITKPGHPTAIGFDLIIDIPYKTVQFYEIASAEKGNGETMLKAVLEAIDSDWEVVIGMDFSMGFWSVMAERYEQVNVI